MPDLIAQGQQPDDRWRKRLEPGVAQVIGRQAEAWSVPWDYLISRQHVEVLYENGQLLVKQLPAARNAVFFRGQQESHFSLKPGEHFVIGRTTFTFGEAQASGPSDLPRPTEEHTFALDELHQHAFRQPDKRIHALSRVPDIVQRAANDQELFQRLVNLLISGIENATAAAIVALEQPAAEHAQENAAVSILHWDRQLLFNADFRPSRRLIRQAITSHQSVAHVWGHGGPGGQGDFTLSDETEWAICTPVSGDACAGWALYVAGTFGSDQSQSRRVDADLLHDDVKYTEIMAATLGGLRQSQRLAARQASLGQFFSPVVMNAISDQDPEQVLAPREVDVTVLFCDLRGFTSESERMSSDLFGLLARVSDALGVMTRHILEQGGVVGDFHGDAAMGFWGWPLADASAAERACRAALGIRANFATNSSCEPKHSSGDMRSPSDFRVGIGIASGRAVAGKIGTTDQVKVTAFGPVVNLASRLETMTKPFPASILIDGPTARAIRDALSPEICRVRRLARVLPLGLTTAIDIFEILPSESDCPDVPNEGLLQYAAALNAFEAGHWEKAKSLLREVPNADRVKGFLLEYMKQQGDAVPLGWDGAMRLLAK